MPAIPANKKFLKLRLLAKDADHGFYFGKHWIVLNFDHIISVIEGKVPGPNNIDMDTITCVLDDGRSICGIGTLDDFLEASDG